MIEPYYINDNKGNVLAIVVKSKYNSDGIRFFTPSDYSQQVGYMSHRKGHIIKPHVHNEVKRQVHNTQEVLIIKDGKLRVDLYDNNREYVVSCEIEKGDLILLASGGHGFEVLDDVKMYEIKQGPHVGEEDKTRFETGEINREYFDEGTYGSI